MTTDKKTSKYQTQEKVENNKNEILSNNSEVISNQIEYPAGDKINPKKRAKARIDSNLKSWLKKLMDKYVLSEDEHAKILEDIKMTSYEGKKSSENPKFVIVLAQTGAGKSNLTSSIYSNDDNLVIIDSDKYKAYRHDNKDILRDHFAEYAYLTAPDAYLHRDEMLIDAMNKKYDILLECAPSEKAGLFVDVDSIKKSGYDVEIHALGVCSLNSSISIHERYEDLLERNSNVAKLTSLDRHDDSFTSLNEAVKENQNKKNVKICVYKRGENGKSAPEKVYDSSNDDKRFSCAYEALQHTQNCDLDKTMEQASTRIGKLKDKMIARMAPANQIMQLLKILGRYEEIQKKRADRGKNK